MPDFKQNRGGIALPPRLPPNGSLRFGGLFLEGQKPVYPFWMYKDGEPPLKVLNTDEEKEARGKGYDSVTAATLSNKHLINWFWDLEDMSKKQLLVFADEEYGVKLPSEADQETLFRAVSELTRHAPQNKNRLVLMAHTVAMNYDATLEEIKRMMINPAPEWESETITFEVEL